jgi:hypothetical protein
MIVTSHAPASEDFDLLSSFHQKLTGYLLKYGERETVIEFLERIAQLSDPAQKSSLLDSADKIRKGIRPLWYPPDEANRQPGMRAEAPPACVSSQSVTRLGTSDDA